MTVSDKKEYRTLLTILDSTSTSATKANKLSKLAIESEDPAIKKVCEAVSNMIRKNGNAALPNHLPSHVAFLKKQPTRTISQNVVIDVMEKSINYCNQVLSTVEPLWQRTARMAGWTPPTS